MMYKDYAYQECCEILKDRLVMMSDRTKALMAELYDLEEHARLLAKQKKLLWRQNALLRERCEILQKKLTETKD